MGILSANPLPCSVYTHAYDFSADSSQVYGGTLSYKELSPGIWGMVTGDSDANGLINDDDKINWSLDAGLNDYISNDFNVDGEVDNQDKDIWEGNRSYITQIPE